MPVYILAADGVGNLVYVRQAVIPAADFDAHVAVDAFRLPRYVHGPVEPAHKIAEAPDVHDAEQVLHIPLLVPDPVLQLFVRLVNASSIIYSLFYLIRFIHSPLDNLL